MFAGSCSGGAPAYQFHSDGEPRLMLQNELEDEIGCYRQFQTGAGGL
jgi:hypothetical protein